MKVPDYLASLTVGAISDPSRHVGPHAGPDVTPLQKSERSSNAGVGQSVDTVEDASSQRPRYHQPRSTLGRVDPKAGLVAPEHQRRRRLKSLCFLALGLFPLHLL